MIIRLGLGVIIFKLMTQMPDSESESYSPTPSRSQAESERRDYHWNFEEWKSQ